MATAVRKKGPQSVRAASAIYLYGISPAIKGKPPRLPVGVDGEHTVRALDLAGKTCWVSSVDAATFAAELERNMESIDWLAEATLRHQRVVSEIAAVKNMTLLPARFGTIFSGPAALEADLKARSKDIASAFKRVAGADEWGVKVFAAAPKKAALVDASSGRDYLKQKARAMTPTAGANDAELVAFSRALKAVARDVAASGKVSSGLPGLIWQATFLVPRARRKQWDAVLRKHAAKWGGSKSIECTGPWPPYSFISS